MNKIYRMKEKTILSVLLILSKNSVNQHRNNTVLTTKHTNDTKTKI